MAIDLRDYARTSAQRGWGAGWPSCSGASGDLATIAANNPDGTVSARVTVRKRLARLVDLLLDECERRGYDFHATQCGGYNCRPIGGTSRPSNHSWGVAVDLNWQLNPMRRPLTTNIPGWMVQLWNRYGFAWGGHYSGTPDTMHFEFMGTPDDADAMTALALRELTAQEEDDMAGAFPYSLPAAAEADEAAEAKGHLEIIPVPPNNGLGAAQGARVWLQLYAGWETVTIHQLAARGAEWKDLLPFGEATEFNAGVTQSWELPRGCTAVEIRYESPEAFSALVEWRKG